MAALSVIESYYCESTYVWISMLAGHGAGYCSNPASPGGGPAQAVILTYCAAHLIYSASKTWSLDFWQDHLALEVDYDDEPIIISVTQAEPSLDTQPVKSESMDDDKEARINLYLFCIKNHSFQIC